MGLGTYWVAVWIHRSGGAASVFPPPPPLDRLVISAGDVIIPATEETPALLAPSLTEVFAAADAAKAADPSLTILLALRQVVYDLISRHHALTPNTVV
jgi:hypothetical protein